MGVKKPPFRVIVAGGRNFQDYSLMKAALDTFLRSKRITHQIIIVSGHAEGADRLGELYASQNAFNVEQYPPKYDLYGRKAPLYRNIEMAENADALIAFWNGSSGGTCHMINTAKRKNLPFRVVYYSSN